MASFLQTAKGGGLSDGILWLAGTNAGWGWDGALRRPDGCRQAVRTRPLYSKKLVAALFFAWLASRQLLVVSCDKVDSHKNQLP